MQEMQEMQEMEEMEEMTNLLQTTIAKQQLLWFHFLTHTNRKFSYLQIADISLRQHVSSSLIDGIVRGHGGEGWTGHIIQPRHLQYINGKVETLRWSTFNWKSVEDWT